MLPSSLDEVHISPENTTDTSDVIDALMESSAPITDEINVHEENYNSQETNFESIIVTLSVSSPSESLEFLVMLHKVNFGVSSFSGCLDFSHEFLQISVVPKNVIPLAVSEVRPPRKPMPLFPITLGVKPSELIALLLAVAHDETLREQFAMMTINLLHFHIVSCKNLQLLMSDMYVSL